MIVELDIFSFLNELTKTSNLFCDLHYLIDNSVLPFPAIFDSRLSEIDRKFTNFKPTDIENSLEFLKEINGEIESLKNDLLLSSFKNSALVGVH